MGIIQSSLADCPASNYQILAFTLIAASGVYGAYKLVVYVKDWKEYIDQFKGVPCPDRHWLFGNLLIHPGTGQRAFEWFIQNTDNYPNYYALHFTLLYPTLVLNNPDTAKRVLKTAAPKQDTYDFLLPWLGFGLLTSYGQQWARNRRLLTPGFHFDILKPYMGVYNEAASVLVNKWEKQTINGNSVEIHKPVSLCTLDVMLQCACSYHDDIQGKGEKHPYVETVISMGKLLVERVFNPIMYIDLIYRLSPNGRTFFNKCAFAHNFANEIIQNRKHQMRQNVSNESKRYVDFLDILILARDEDGKGLSDLEIRQEVDTFLFEGHDTTASAISWFLYSIAKNPKYQKKCQDEIDRLFNGRNSETVEYEDLNQIPFLQQCIKEALRLHSPVHFIGRLLSEPLQLDGHVFRKGTSVDIPIYQIHHNKAVWGVDHKEFKPERFSPENIDKLDSYDFIPFSAGPRNCIGQNFAMHEIKTIAIRVLRKFDLKVDESVPVKYLGDVVMRSENGIHLYMSPRKRD